MFRKVSTFQIYLETSTFQRCLILRISKRFSFSTVSLKISNYKKLQRYPILRISKRHPLSKGLQKFSTPPPNSLNLARTKAHQSPRPDRQRTSALHIRTRHLEPHPRLPTTHPRSLCRPSRSRFRHLLLNLRRRGHSVIHGPSDGPSVGVCRKVPSIPVRHSRRVGLWLAVVDPEIEVHNATTQRNK